MMHNYSLHTRLTRPSSDSIMARAPQAPRQLASSCSSRRVFVRAGRANTVVSSKPKTTQKAPLAPYSVTQAIKRLQRMPGKLQEGALCSFFYIESRHEAAGTSSNTANLEVAMLELCLAHSTLAAKQECAKQALTWGLPVPSKCDSSAILAQERDVKDKASTLSYLVHKLLNGNNTRAGLELTALPFHLSLTLLESLQRACLITADGRPVYRPQPSSPFLVSLPEYLHISAGFVGSFTERAFDSNMVAVPDPFPWLNSSALSSLLSLNLVSTALWFGVPESVHLLSTASAAGVWAAPEGCFGEGVAAAGLGALHLWLYLLARRFPAAFAQQQLQAAGRAVGAAAAAAAAGHAGASSKGGSGARGGRPRTSGDGGSGRGGVLTAVGAGDEAELPALCPVLVLPVQKLAGSGCSSSQRSGAKHWLRRLFDAAGRAVSLRV